MKLPYLFVSSFLFPRKLSLTQISKPYSPIPEKSSSTIVQIPHLKNNVTMVFLPGTCVSPSEYHSILQNIKTECEYKDMNVDVFVQKFTGNVMQRFEVDMAVNSIKKKFGENPKNLIIVGHSAGAVVGLDIAEKVNASAVVAWCGSFNSEGNLPWDVKDSYGYNVTSLTLLSEYDKLIPFPIAVTEFCDRTSLNSQQIMFASIIKHGNHFSGLRRDRKSDASRDISWKISEFMTFMFTDGERMKTAEKYTRQNSDMLSKDFRGLCANSHVEVSRILKTITSVRNTHYNIPPSMLLTVLYITLPLVRPYIHGLVLFPLFVFSQPTKTDSFSYSPMYNFFPMAKLNVPFVWIKLESLPDKKNRARDINISVFEEAFESLSFEQQERYRVYGKKIKFGDDISFPHVPGCSLLWLTVPVIMTDVKGELLAKSPTIDMGSRMNAKVFSKQNCVEWITSKAFEK